MDVMDRLYVVVVIFVDRGVSVNLWDLVCVYENFYIDSMIVSVFLCRASGGVSGVW